MYEYRSAPVRECPCRDGTDGAKKDGEWTEHPSKAAETKMGKDTFVRREEKSAEAR